MKKIIVILFLILFLCGCETQEEVLNRKEQKEMDNIKKDVDKMSIPESTKEWTLDIKTEKVLTILCMSTSSKCKNIKDNFDKININKKYYISIDEITEEEKNTYKNKFELDNYTGYVPYLILSEKDKLINTKTDVNNIEEINSFINN